MGECHFSTHFFALTFIVLGLKSIKDMFSSDDNVAQAVKTTSDPGTFCNGNLNGSADATTRNAPSPKSGRKLFGKRTSLPPGTGPGTSGLPAAESDAAMQNDLEHSKASQSSSRYGSATAMGGCMPGTYQGTGIDRTAARDGRPRTMNGDQVFTDGQATSSYARASELGPDSEGNRR